MFVANPIKQRYQLSYKKKEAPIFHKLEHQLMEDLGIATRCDLHKYAIKFLASTRKQSSLAVM